jgi:hypothetical protein
VKNESRADACWQDLADAMIVQAAKDYRHTMKMLQENDQSTQLLIDQQRLEVFFRSDWFQQLTNLNGRQLLNDLQKEAAQ